MRSYGILVSLIVWLLGPATFSAATTLQSVYDAAGPGEGYDRLLVLSGDMTYTGGLHVARGLRSCIHGNGATIDLGYESVWVAGYGTILDIDHCVLVNGYSGIYISEDATATVRNNTIRGNTYGISSWYGNIASLVENNIIVENKSYGIHCREFFDPDIQYNTVWGNPGGNYMKNCG